MPVYEQTYRSFDGQLRHRFRWAIVVKQELKVLVREKAFMILMVFALLHFLARVLQVVAFDIVVQNPNNPLTSALEQIDGLAVNEAMFFDFIRIQGPIVFIVALYAGAGMICNDVRNNLMEIYFSKPISWIDYALGKIITLTLLGLVVTALPGLVLVGMHILFLPTMDTLRDAYWWPFAIVAHSLVIVVPCALGVLASSSLLSSQNFAAISIFMVLSANSVMGALLATMLRDNNYLIVSFPMALDRVGQFLFRDNRMPFSLHWGWALLFVSLVSLWSLWVIFRKARRSEMAK